MQFLVSAATKAEVAGLYAKTNDNVVLDNYPAKWMTPIQCANAR